MNIRALLAAFPIYCDKFSNVSHQLMRCFRHERAVDLYRSKPQSCLTGPLQSALPLFSGIGALLCDNPYCFPS